MTLVNLPSPISFPQKKIRDSNVVSLWSPILSATKRLARAALGPLQIVYRRDPDIGNEDLHSGKLGPKEDNAFSNGGYWPSVVGFEAEEAETDDDHASDVPSPVPSPAASSFGKRRSSLISVSTSKSSLVSPTEWETWKEEKEARRRRKRLSKLTRHLGETIPHDLDMPKQESAKAINGSPLKKRFVTVITPPVPPVVASLRTESPTSERGTPLSPSPPSSLPDPRPAVEKTVDVEVFDESTTGPTSPCCADPSSPRSLCARKPWRSHSEYSISLPREHSAPLNAEGYFEADDLEDMVSVEGSREQAETRPLMVPPPRSESRLGFLRLRPGASSPEPFVMSHRRERRQGWSGEWNAASMQDVISKLRDLR